MTQKWYMDCETVGFHGLPVTIQYAIDNGPIQIHEVWRRPARDTLQLIEEMMKHQVVGFNLAFDHFHLQKVYTTLSLLDDQSVHPQDCIEDLGDLEYEARDGPCVKPADALDLMLHFRRTELQVTMERDDVRIRRVPKLLAPELAKLLTERIRLDPLLFAGQKKWAPRFQVEDVRDDNGDPHPQLRNVVLKFRPSAGLKALATHLLGAEAVKFNEVEVDKKFRPKEYGYAPFARAVGKRGRWNGAWPDVVKYHIQHWAFNALARKYAEADVLYTRQLHEHTGWIAGGDTDSILACMVASCRWRGYNVDTEKLGELIKVYKERQTAAPAAPSRVKAWINEVLNPIEQAMVWRDGTSKKALQALMEIWSEEKPEAARRAKAVLDARKARKKVELLEKLHRAGRFHASFKVIGALSGRMSGTDQLNATGIDKTTEVRSCFPLAFPGEDLNGGDMQSFEISIAEADYGDPQLREKLTTCEKCDIAMVVREGRVRCPQCNGLDSKSFHGLFGAGFFPELGYEGVMKTKGLKEGNLYNPCKNAAFATLYGAQPAKLATTIGVSEDEAVEGFHRFWRTYEVAGQKRRKVELAFTSLYNEGTSSKILYKTPEEFIESLLGYRRYFTLENYLIAELNELCNNLPKSWMKIKVKVTRSRKGEQNVGAAVRSALYGCAFGLQNSCIRQAANHRIQSTGAGITKAVQRAIWELQPSGVHPWLVRPMQVHDEIQCPTAPAMSERVREVVRTRVEEFRPLIPLVGIDFTQINSWADK